MPNPDNEPQLPKNQSPITDDRTGLVSRDWYRFFLNLLNKANQGGGGGTGTVTSVNVSGGTTGLTTSGGPVTTSGTITLAGTLDVDNGGTGATTAANARTNLDVPSTSGSGATGTWGISVSGGAAAVTNALAASNGASLVGYVQGGSGSVATTVQNKLRQSVSFKDFGAVGDGVTNDTASVLLALNSGAKIVNGQGLTYKLTSNITPNCENIVIENAAFDISGITTGGAAITLAGTQAASTALTSDILTGSSSIAVTSTLGFTADDYAWLSSATIFDTTTSTTLGQIVSVKSVDSGTTMTLYNDVLYDFTTAASAAIAVLTPKQNITLRDINFVGANTGIQTAINFEKCVNVLVDNCTFDYVDYASISFDRCVNATVTNTSMRYARAVGLSYGIVIGNGCYNVKIANCYGEDQRHLVTVGNNNGVNLFVSVINCHATAQRDAGLDSHSAGDFILFTGNTIELAAAQSDGIICQGLNAIISNNIIVGNVTTGIRHQLLPEISTGSSVITGNSIENTGATASTDTAIYVEQLSGGGAVMQGVVIANNRIDGAIEQGIYVYANTGYVKNVTITGNVLTSDATIFACYLRAAATYSLENFAITGNIFNCSGVSNVYLLGTTAPNILNGTISGNTIKGGTNGIRMIQTQDVVETGNYNTGVTRKVFVDTGSSDVWMDRRTSSVVTITGSTYTVLDQDEFLIANRAGTITVTLPNAIVWPGRVLSIKTIQSQSVISASSNVVPLGGATAGTLILPTIDGAWANLKSNGIDWVITESSTASEITGTLPIVNGGTGQTTASAAFNALSPVTSTGDLIIGNGANSSTRLPIGANNYVLTSNGTTATWAVATGSGATITNDTSTSTNVYPTFAAATSGSLSTIYTSNAKYLYKPSTGELTSEHFVAGNGIFVNSLTIDTSYTIAAGTSGMSAGPITVASGTTVTVSSGSRWVVV